MNKNIVYGGIILAIVLSVLGLVGGHQSASTTLGVAQKTDTNFNNLGVLTLGVGTGCNDSNSTCTGVQINAAGNIVTPGTSTFGGILSTTTPASLTLAQSDLGYSTISSLLTVGAATITLPASTTLTTFLPNAGDRTSIALVNATTSAFNITLAGNTGSLFQNASTSAVILPKKTGLLFVTRKADTDLTFTFVPAI